MTRPQADTGEAPLQKRLPGPLQWPFAPLGSSLLFLFLRRSIFSFPGWGWEAALLLGGGSGLVSWKSSPADHRPMGPGTSSTAKPRPAHLQMEPSSAATEATAQLEPDWGSGEGRKEGMGGPLGPRGGLHPESRLILVRATPHEVLSFHQENTCPEQKTNQLIPAPPERGSSVPEKGLNKVPSLCQGPRSTYHGLCPGAGTGVVSKKPKRQSPCLAKLAFWGRSQLREQDQNVRKAGGARQGKRPGKGDRGHVGRERGSGPRKGGKKGGNPAHGGCSRPQRKRTGPEARRPARRVQTERGKVAESIQCSRGSGYASPHPPK